MQTNELTASQGRAWITQGWGDFRRDAPLWLAMAAIYLAIALVLQLVPFIGYLVLVLITPLLAAGALGGVASRPSPLSTLPLVERLKGLVRQAAGQLFQVLLDAERTLAIMVVATLALGAVVMIQVLAQLLKVGGAALPAMAAGSVGVSIWLPALISLLVVWILKLALILISLFAVYVIAIRQETPLAALEASINACAQNAAPVGVLALVFLVPLAIAPYFGSLAVVAVGLIALPLFVTSSYAGYKDMFGE